MTEEKIAYRLFSHSANHVVRVHIDGELMVGVVDHVAIVASGHRRYKKFLKKFLVIGCVLRTAGISH